MGFHFYTDGWWRNPKNAVTTEATIVEIRKTHRFGGSEYKNAGYYQSVVVDVSDPATGQITRTTNSEVYSGLQPFQVGQRITVRWSAKRKTFELYSWNTAPEGDGTAGAQGLAEAISGAGPTPVATSELSSDQAARVQQVLGALGVSGTSSVQVVRTPTANKIRFPSSKDSLRCVRAVRSPTPSSNSRSGGSSASRRSRGGS